MGTPIEMALIFRLWIGVDKGATSGAEEEVKRYTHSRSCLTTDLIHKGLKDAGVIM